MRCCPGLPARGEIATAGVSYLVRRKRSLDMSLWVGKEKCMLRYTGHPLIDVGVATITAFASKSDPAEVTDKDLNAIAEYIEREYSKNPMKSFLTTVFPNSGFVQPAFDKQPEKRVAYARTVLFKWHDQAEQTRSRCVFFDMPAAIRVHRQAIPMIGPEDGFNFFAEGESGLPVSGLALLAIHALPLGSLKCEGRMLFVHADRPDITFLFAEQALEANRRYLNLKAQADKYDDVKYPKTQIIEQLLRAEERRSDLDLCSMTAYHMTNYGTKPGVDIYHLPLQMMRFLVLATEATHRDAWRQIVRRGWEGESDDRDEFGFSKRRNVLYEDLFDLPREARRFLRTYILRMPQVQKSKTRHDPRVTYNLLTEADLVSWSLTTLFLKEVMNVEEHRIEAIRVMADRLADYIDTQNDQHLFRTLLYGKNSGKDYQDLRTRLIRADYRVAPSSGPLFTLDEFVTVFENSDNQYTWILARDLLLIRIIERLYQRGTIAQLSEVISAPPETPDVEEA
jgi:CRISPR-associated protein Cst1